MLFSTTTFLFLFLPVVLLLYYNPITKRSRKLGNIILMLSSLFFYAWGEPILVFVMIFSIFANWLFGYMVNKFSDTNKSRAKFFLISAVIFDIGILFIFKYLTFTLKNINLIFNTDINTLNITLPIGISFFTFQAMSYVIDVYRKHGEAQKNIINVALYISFFPQLIAGPIVRYETVAHQIQNREENVKDFCDGVCRFIIGLSKKIIIANNLALVADNAFGQDNLSVAMAWLGAIAYTLQIFFDFSGYSDMAIGLGKMFGFHFLENFNYPYISKSITEFWRRWHISLGTWFRDYVYFPLGGSRVKTKSRLIFNLFVVWILTGIWHGANWTFLAWGFLYFVLLSIEKLTGFTKKIGFAGHIYAMLFVILGWVFFRADSIGDAGSYISAMFGLSGAKLYDSNFLMYISYYKVYLIAGILCSFPILSFIKNKIHFSKKASAVITVITLIALFVFSLSFMIKGAYNPFIYFNF